MAVAQATNAAACVSTHLQSQSIELSPLH